MGRHVLDWFGSGYWPVEGSCITVMKLRIPNNFDKFLSNYETGAFSRRDQLSEVSLVSINQEIFIAYKPTLLVYTTLLGPQIFS
jgi:hypothetical protein